MAKLVREAGLADRFVIDSAGTGSWHVGELADGRSRRAAEKRGLELTHRARQIRRADLAHFDLILVMDGHNWRHVMQMAEPRGARAQIRLLRSFDPTASESAEVPDPYSGGEAGFEEVLDQCERACAGLLAHVREVARSGAA